MRFRDKRNIITGPPGMSPGGIIVPAPDENTRLVCPCGSTEFELVSGWKIYLAIADGEGKPDPRPGDRRILICLDCDSKYETPQEIKALVKGEHPARKEEEERRKGEICPRCEMRHGEGEKCRERPLEKSGS